MAVALHGNLRDFGVGEVFQLIGQQRKTGVLDVTGDDSRLRIAFEGGAVAWGELAGPYPESGLGEMLVRTGLLTPERLVEIEQEIQEFDRSLAEIIKGTAELSDDQLEDTLDLVTRDTVFELLRWKSGSFHFNTETLVFGRDPARVMPAEQILMDGLRMVDEWSTLDPVAVDPASVFERSGHFDSYRNQIAGAPPDAVARAERLFLLIDGRLASRRIIDLSRLGTFEGARVLSELRRAGLISPVDPATLMRDKRRRVLPDVGRGPAIAAAALAGLPFVLLATLVLVLAWRGPVVSTRGLEVAGLRPSGQHRAAHSFEQRRMRHAVEAYRFAFGRWPGELSELAEFSGERAWTMAPDEGHEYYYAHRGETFLVLAPAE